MFLDLMRSGLRLVKLFLGGQTVKWGKSRSDMGRVSMVVVMGLLAQLEKDCWIRIPAPEKPATEWRPLIGPNQLRYFALVGEDPDVATPALLCHKDTA